MGKIRIPPTLTLEDIQAAFRDVEKALSPSGVVNMNASRLSNVANGVSPGDAVTLAQLEGLRKKLGLGDSNPSPTEHRDLEGRDTGIAHKASSIEVTPFSTIAATRVQAALEEIVSEIPAPVSFPVTTKGDLFGFSTVAARVPVGTNYQRLVPDSTQALGVKWWTPHGCLLTKSAVQSIPNTTETVLTFDQERYDVGSLHDNVTNSSRITVSVAGKYEISTHVSTTTAAGVFYTFLKLNGTLLYYLDTAVTNASFGAYLNATLNLDLAANDYIELGIYQSTGGAMNANARFGAHWLGD